MPPCYSCGTRSGVGHISIPLLDICGQTPTPRISVLFLPFWLLGQLASNVPHWTLNTLYNTFMYNNSNLIQWGSEYQTIAKTLSQFLLVNANRHHSPASWLEIRPMKTQESTTTTTVWAHFDSTSLVFI